MQPMQEPPKIIGMEEPGGAAEERRPRANSVNGVSRTVSWQDFHGKDLFTVREFEPSEGPVSVDEEQWEEHRPCCSLM